MKEPKPPTLLRLKPIIAKALYHDALNLEGFDTLILDGRLVSPLAFARISTPNSCQRSRTCERSSRGCVFSVCTTVTRLILRSARKFAEGKSCGKTIHRLSNMSSRRGFVPFKRKESRTKAGGASDVRVSARIRGVPSPISFTKELISSTTTADGVKRLG